MLLDQDKIEKVLVNLLSNAFKFTKEGGAISVNLRKNHNTIYISITDNGCGIEKDKQSLIFERFYTTKITTIREQELDCTWLKNL